jgi:hypothetical protein
MFRACFVALLAPALCLILAPAAPVPREDQYPVLYFPTKVGTKWVYEDGTDEKIIGERTETITEVEVKADGAIVTIGRPDGEKVLDRRKVYVTLKGLFFNSAGASEAPAFVPWLKLPVSEKERWTQRPLEESEINFAVVGAEEVSVPAGKYHAVRVERKKGHQKFVEWFAPKVGVVKYVLSARVSDHEERVAYTSVLKSFTLGKD